jgi:hypothetical protein
MHTASRLLTSREKESPSFVELISEAEVPTDGKGYLFLRVAGNGARFTVLKDFHPSW